jgi:SAM-dependent methyltransferase
MDPAYVTAHREEDRAHWWFRGRRAAGLDVRAGALPADRVVPRRWPDVVLLLDVIEHLDDDAAALRAARDMPAPGGTLMVTVPAYPSLWSAHDVVLGHRRRDRASGLRAVVQTAGFTVTHLSYLNALLLPGAALVRAWKTWRGQHRHDLARPPAPLKAALAGIFALDAAIVPRGPLPCGASLLAVGRR